MTTTSDPASPHFATPHFATERFAEFDAHVRRLVTGDPRDLGEGVVRALVEGDHDLTEDELVGDIANVVFAGHETTASTLSDAFVRLLRDRTVRAALADGAAPVDDLVEELLRVETARIGLFRATAEPVRLASVDLPAGARLRVSFGAAHRDPDVVDDPDAARPGRPRARESVMFGHGIHSCIGAAPARVQLRIALTAVPRAHPALRLDGEVAETPNSTIRSTPRVPVTRC